MKTKEDSFDDNVIPTIVDFMMFVINFGVNKPYFLMLVSSKSVDAGIDGS